MAIKTLHLTNAFHPQSGGISTFYMAMLQMANQQGREMRLIVPGTEDRVEQVGEHGRIYFVRAPAAPLNDSYRCIYPNQFLYPHTTIRRILREERPDVIEICDKYNLNYLGAMIRVGLLADLDFRPLIRPLILGLSCERMDDNFAAYVGKSVFHRWFCRWYMHWIYFPFFDHHLAVSEHAAMELVGASHGHSVQRGIWIRPMGVDVARFTPRSRSEAMRRQLLESSGGAQRAGHHDPTLLLYAGRLAPEKNLPLLIEMMRSLNQIEVEGEPRLDYRLIMVGEGIERERLQRLTQQLLPAPERVSFQGHTPDRGRLAEIYASCDLFIHPNPREPFGLAPLEAMASGLPLVAANSGGITSFAGPANAWLVEPQAEAFAAAVQQAVQDHAGRTLKVQAALVTAAEHSWDRAALAYFSLYDELHAQFRGLDAPVCSAPYTCSTPATKAGGARITAFAMLVQTLFRTVMSVTGKFGGPAFTKLPGRYPSNSAIRNQP